MLSTPRFVCTSFGSCTGHHSAVSTSVSPQVITWSEAKSHRSRIQDQWDRWSPVTSWAVAPPGDLVFLTVADLSALPLVHPSEAK
jgi:hypothetical protein